MPPLTKIGAANEVGIARVICLICEQPIGERQEKGGKAVCIHCENRLFASKFTSFHREILPVEDFMRQKKEQEEKVFLDFMQRVFDRLF